ANNSMCRQGRRSASESSLFPYTTLVRSVEYSRIPAKPRASRIVMIVPRFMRSARDNAGQTGRYGITRRAQPDHRLARRTRGAIRSEEHTSELQSREKLVCRLLLEKEKAH